MLRIIKNNWNRLIIQKGYLILSVVLTICAVSAAIVLTNKSEIKGNIAIINSNSTAAKITSAAYNITYLNEEPAESELLQNRYDAAITVNKDGSYEIKTVKSSEFKESLENLIKNPSASGGEITDIRKIGTNIIGYSMMFILMQGALYARLFAEDKEKHMIKRVAVSPITFMDYLMGHAVFVWILIFLPTISVLLIAKLLSISLGLSILNYIMLIGLLSFLSTAFALMINSFFRVADTANMMASSTIVLTTILSGSYYSFTSGDSIFNKLLHLLPQKDFINFTEALEKGNITMDIRLQAGYVVIISVMMFLTAVVKTKKEYIYNK